MKLLVLCLQIIITLIKSPVTSLSAVVGLILSTGQVSSTKILTTSTTIQTALVLCAVADYHQEDEKSSSPNGPYFAPNVWYAGCCWTYDHTGGVQYSYPSPSALGLFELRISHGGSGGYAKTHSGSSAYDIMSITVTTEPLSRQVEVIPI